MITKKGQGIDAVLKTVGGDKIQIGASAIHNFHATTAQSYGLTRAWKQYTAQIDGANIILIETGLLACFQAPVSLER